MNNMGIVRFLQKYSTGMTVSILFALTMVVYCLMLFYSIPAVSVFAPELPIFDLSPAGYSFEYASELLNTLGEEGREIYISTQLPIDFIYPGLFSITYTLMLVWLFGKLFSVHSNMNIFVLVPFLAGIFDYFENIFIIKMLNSFPDLQQTTVKVASTFTLLKSGFTIFFFTILIVGFVLLVKQSVANTRNKDI